MVDELQGTNQKGQEDDPYKGLTPKKVLLNPKFHTYAPDVRRFMLSKIDPVFEGLDRADQDQALSLGVDYWNKYFAPAEEKGILEKAKDWLFPEQKPKPLEAPPQTGYGFPVPPPGKAPGLPAEAKAMVTPPASLPPPPPDQRLIPDVDPKTGQIKGLGKPTWEESVQLATKETAHAPGDLNYRIADIQVRSESMAKHAEDLKTMESEIKNSTKKAKTQEDVDKANEVIRLFNKSLNEYNLNREAVSGEIDQLNKLFNLSASDAGLKRTEEELKKPTGPSDLERFANIPFTGIINFNAALNSAKKYAEGGDHPLMGAVFPATGGLAGVESGMADLLTSLTSPASIALFGLGGPALQALGKLSPILKVLVGGGFTYQMASGMMKNTKEATDALVEHDPEKFGRALIAGLGDAVFTFLSSRGMVSEAGMWAGKFKDVAAYKKWYKEGKWYKGMRTPTGYKGRPILEIPALPPAPEELRFEQAKNITPGAEAPEMGGTVLREQAMARQRALPPAPGVTLPGGEPVVSRQADIIPGQPGGLEPFRRMEKTLIGPEEGVKPGPVPESDRPMSAQDYLRSRIIPST